MFDADAYLTALEPPSLTLGGQVYVGRLLSLPEALKLQRRMQTFSGGGEGAEEDVLAAVREVCTAVGIPSEPVLTLPLPAIVEALQSFLATGLAPVRRREKTEEAPTPGSN